MINEVSKELLNSLKLYHEMLKGFSEDDFTWSPSLKEWSCSEVYCHVIQVNFLSLLAIEKCLHGRPSGVTHSLPFITKMIFLFGKFPPIKIKAPAKIAASVKKISLEDARNDLIRFRSRFTAALPKLSKSSSSCKVKHPRLGMLNSHEWLQFMEIHTRHHLRQIKKIRKSLKKAS